MSRCGTRTAASTAANFRASGAKYRPVRMRRIRYHALQFRIDDEIHGLQSKNPHQTFVPQHRSLGHECPVLESDFDRLDARDTLLRSS